MVRLSANMLLFLLVSIFAEGSTAETIEDTAEWKSCIANPPGCTELKLYGRSLTGGIPTAIGRLYNLVILHLYSNKLSGSIPNEIGECTKLEVVYLQGNKFSGTIPAEFRFTRLEVFYGTGNALSGSIPPELFESRTLTNLFLGDNKLSGSIPTAIGRCYKLRQIYLNNNELTGKIPTELQYVTALEFLHLQDNKLSGPLPSEIGHSKSKLSVIQVQNNRLEGPLPGQTYGTGIWHNLRAKIRKLLLQNNRFTGVIPTQLFRNAYSSTYPLSVLNVGDNQLSGPVPTRWEIYGSQVKVADLFSELWLLGNNWDGGPCVALCGVNSGPMDDTKRDRAKLWAKECLQATSTHKDLPDSEYYIDELGRCSLKSPTCSKANYYITSRSIVNPDCRRCPVHTFQPRSDHNETKCDQQPKCNAGQKLSQDNQDLRTSARSCSACSNHTYQAAENHRLTECIVQPTCGVGQRISVDSQTQRRICTACPTGQYQDKSNHREISCIKQAPCPAGTEYENAVTAKRNCTSCGPNSYQTTADPGGTKTAACTVQPTCGAGQRISADSQTQRQICTACPTGQYQDKSNHRETSCTKQTPCPAGTEFEIAVTTKRNCTSCGPNSYQTTADPGGTKTAACIVQPTCGVGQRISAESPTQRQICTACPTGQYQNATNHRETNCVTQQVCEEGTQFETITTEARKCDECDDNTYQSTKDPKALNAFCIEQPSCGIGQRISADTITARRTCMDCPSGSYQNQTSHRDAKCMPQPRCELAGTFYKASLYNERECKACPLGEYQAAANHSVLECNRQNRCDSGYGFVGNAAVYGTCVICSEAADEYQDEQDHREPCKKQQSCTLRQTAVPESTITEKKVCIDNPNPPQLDCSGAGTPNEDTGTCNCDGPATGIGPTCSEYSNANTCNGIGTVRWLPAEPATPPSCTDCNDPSKGVGDYCQFNNIATCNDFGVVSAAGVCAWIADDQGKPIVSECQPGYYYNPKPTAEQSGTEEDGIIAADVNGCFPCSPGQFASGTVRRVKCDECPTAKVETDEGTFLEMLQTSEPASTSASDCFAKFQSAADDQRFCFGESSTDLVSDSTNDVKPLSRITSSEECSISAISLGFAFVGKFEVPYPGCVYDERRQEARFYVPADSSNIGSDEAPLFDTPICELFVCPDPRNDVTALVKEYANPLNLNEKPACRVSEAQIQAAVQEESKTNRKTFVPAMLSIGSVSLVGAYGYQYWSVSKKEDKSFDKWMHVHAWLIFLRVIDMQSDFGFYFISAKGAFLEAYGDGDPETNPYEESNVAAFHFACVFFTALGLFLMPFDIWVTSQRFDGDSLGFFSILIILSISLFEDLPQAVLALIYMSTMKKAGIPTDAVAVLSLLASAVSLLFAGGTVFSQVRRLREDDPTGWWKFGAAEDKVEVKRLKKENDSFRKSFKSGSLTTQVANPMYNVDAHGSSDYLDISESLEAQRADTAEQTVGTAALEAENAALKKELAELKQPLATIVALEAENAALKKELAELKEPLDTSELTAMNAALETMFSAEAAQSSEVLYTEVDVGASKKHVKPPKEEKAAAAGFEGGGAVDNEYHDGSDGGESSIPLVPPPTSAPAQDDAGFPEGFEVGKRCSVPNYSCDGVIRFLGLHAENGKLRVGIELDKPVGKHNGSPKGTDHTYFSCQNKHGILVPHAKVKLLEAGGGGNEVFGGFDDHENQMVPEVVGAGIDL